MSIGSQLRRKASRLKGKQNPRRQGFLSRKKLQIPRSVKTFWKGVSWTWKVAGLAFAVLGMISTLGYFRARVSVTPGQTLKDSDPFATMFTLQNEGEFTLYNVKFSCLIDTSGFENRTYKVAGNFANDPSFDVPELASGVKTNAPCYAGFDLNSPVTHADATLIVSYRPSFYPFRKTSQFHYRAYQKPDKSYAWVETAR